MRIWDFIDSATGIVHFIWTFIGAVVIAFALGAIAPRERPRLRSAVVIALFALAATIASAIILQNGRGNAPSYRYLHFAAQLLFSLFVINVAGVLLFQILLPPIGLRPAPILRDTLLGIAYVVVAITLLSRHGVNLSGIVATSAVVTAVIGFSLQDTLGNVMGGVALQMERSIEVGDWVRIGEVEGVVRQIRWRQTSVETRNWDTVVIPNSVLMKSQVTILGRREGKPKLHRMWVEFNVDFRTPPSQVIDVVLAALRCDPIPNVAMDPAPDCNFVDFRDSYGHYACRYWLVDFHRDTSTSSEVRTRIFVALQRAQISPSIPAQSVFMTMESRSRTERKEQEEKARRAHVLKAVRLFDPLTDAERGDLAGRLTVAPFRKGEVITRQGNDAHYLYILAKGRAEVKVTKDGFTKTVAELGEDDVFGEVGMLTGERRIATVVALTDVVCYRLDKEAFQLTLQRRPEIADAISHHLAHRRLELEALNAQTPTEQQVGNAQRDLLQRIKKFFTLS